MQASFGREVNTTQTSVKSNQYARYSDFTSREYDLALWLYPVLYSENNSWIYLNLALLLEKLVLYFSVRLVGPESQKFLGRKVCWQLRRVIIE